MLLSKPTSTAISFDVKKKLKTHIKRNATGSNKRTPPSPHKLLFFHPPTTLFAPFATGLLSYLVPYSILLPTHKSIYYWPVTLLTYHFA
jgi:hypothetical protein